MHWCYYGDRGMYLFINWLNHSYICVVFSVMTMMGTIDSCLGVLADVLKILGLVSSSFSPVYVYWVHFNWSIVRLGYM